MITFPLPGVEETSTPGSDKIGSQAPKQLTIRYPEMMYESAVLDGNYRHRWAGDSHRVEKRGNLSLRWVYDDELGPRTIASVAPIFKLDVYTSRQLGRSQ